MTTADGDGPGPAAATAPDPVGAPADGTPDDIEREVQHLRRRVAELEHQRRPGRQVLTAVLALLTVLAIVATTATVWATRTALDTDRFAALVTPVLASPEVADAITVRVTQETLSALALEERLGEGFAELQVALGDELAEALELEPAQRARVRALPIPQLEDLAGPVAGGLEARIAARIEQFVASPEFERLLVEGTVLAHAKAVALLRGDMEQLPNVEAEAGEVRLNLVPVVARALEDLVDQGLAAVGVDEIPFIDPFADPQVSLQRLEGALGTELPEDFGQLTVMSEDELAELQAATRAADRFVWVLVLVSLVLLALTVVAAPRRRRALVQVALGTAAGAVVTMALLRSVVDDIAAVAVNPEGSAAVRLLADATLDSLRTAMIVLLVVALVVAAVCHLLGRPAWSLRAVAAVRSATTSQPGGSELQRRVVASYDLLQVGVVAVSVVLLLIVGLSIWSVLILSGLALLALWGLAAVRSRAETVEPTTAPEPAEPGTAGQTERLSPMA